MKSVKPPLLHIRGNGEVVLHSKRRRLGETIFAVKSLPLHPGDWRFGPDGWSQSFRLAVLPGSPVSCVKLYSTNPTSLDGDVLAFGPGCDKIFKKFELGETLVVFGELEKAMEGHHEAAFFHERKLILRGRVQQVVRKYRSVVYRYVTEKYGKELGL
jgi:hypothetical protein